MPEPLRRDKNLNCSASESVTRAEEIARAAAEKATAERAAQKEIADAEADAAKAARSAAADEAKTAHEAQRAAEAKQAAAAKIVSDAEAAVAKTARLAAADEAFAAREARRALDRAAEAKQNAEAKIVSDALRATRAAEKTKRRAENAARVAALGPIPDQPLTRRSPNPTGVSLTFDVATDPIAKKRDPEGFKTRGVAAKAEVRVYRLSQIPASRTFPYSYQKGALPLPIVRP